MSLTDSLGYYTATRISLRRHSAPFGFHSRRQRRLHLHSGRMRQLLRHDSILARNYHRNAGNRQPPLRLGLSPRLRRPGKTANGLPRVRYLQQTPGQLLRTGQHRPRRSAVGPTVHSSRAFDIPTMTFPSHVKADMDAWPLTVPTRLPFSLDIPESGSYYHQFGHGRHSYQGTLHHHVSSERRHLVGAIAEVAAISSNSTRASPAHLRCGHCQRCAHRSVSQTDFFRFATRSDEGARVEAS